jgi:hypothetical protein
MEQFSTKEPFFLRTTSSGKGIVSNENNRSEKLLFPFLPKRQRFFVMEGVNIYRKFVAGTRHHDVKKQNNSTIFRKSEPKTNSKPTKTFFRTFCVLYSQNRDISILCEN